MTLREQHERIVLDLAAVIAEQHLSGESVLKSLGATSKVAAYSHAEVLALVRGEGPAA